MDKLFGVRKKNGCKKKKNTTLQSKVKSISNFLIALIYVYVEITSYINVRFRLFSCFLALLISVFISLEGTR